MNIIIILDYKIGHFSLIYAKKIQNEEHQAIVIQNESKEIKLDALKL